MTQAVRTRSSASRVRNALFSRTALGASLLVVSAAGAGMAAGGAAAQTVNAGTFTPGAGAVVSATGGQTSVISTSSDKTLLNWGGGFNHTGGDRLDFRLPGRQAIVLNKVTGSANIDGQLNSFVGSSANIGGNVWFSASGGVVFGKNAVVNVGGMLATTAGIADTDFLGGNFGFNDAAAASAIRFDAGSSITSHGGMLAFVAPIVLAAEGSSITGAPDSQVLFGAAQGYEITFAPDAAGDLDLFSWVVPASELGSDSANPITLDGAVKAGEVYVAAVSRRAATSVISLGGTVTATTASAEGGAIVLSGGGGIASGQATAGPAGSGSVNVELTGTLNAASATGKGGEVTVTGADIALKDALVDASGATGGGTVLIGGDFQGQGDLARARTTSLDAASVVRADAKTQGDGGTVILWSDEITHFDGFISARGGQAGGDGGLVETSGKARLLSTGLVDASAPNGKSGQWLLDPYSIIIADLAGATDVTPGAVFESTLPSSDPRSTVSASSINTALNAGTSVEIRTGAGGGPTDLGDILVQSAITKSSGLDATLKLVAHNDIQINAPITAAASAGRLHLDFVASNGTNDTLGVNGMAFNAPIDLNGGNASFVSAGNGRLLFNNSFLANDVTVNGPGGVVFNSGISVTRLNLNGGAVSQSAAITAGTLSGTGSSSINLAAAGNSFGTIAGLRTSGTMSILDSVGGLDVTGQVSANFGLTLWTSGALVVAESATPGQNSVTGRNVSLKGQDLTLSSLVTAGSDLDLDAGTGLLTVNSGTTSVISNYRIKAGSFAGAEVFSPNQSSSGIASKIDIVDRVGSFTTTQAITSVGGILIQAEDGAVNVQHALTAGGADGSRAGDITLIGKNAVAINAPVQAIGDSIQIYATDPNSGITQTAAGVITSRDLTVSASGAVTLAAASNAVNNLINSNGGGTLNFRNQGALTTRAITAGAGGVSIQAEGGALNIATGGVDALGSVTLRGDTVGVTGQVTSRFVGRHVSITGDSIAVTNSGVQSVGGNVTLNGSTALHNSQLSASGATSITGALSLTSSNQVNAGGAATFGGSVDSGATSGGLAVTAGSANFAGAVGGTSRLSALTVSSANTTVGGSVLTTGGATFTGNVTIAAGAPTAITFDGGSGPVQFANLSAGAGAGLDRKVTFASDVSASGSIGASGAALKSVQFDGDATIGGGVTATGAVDFNGALTLGGPASGTVKIMAGEANFTTVNAGTGSRLSVDATTTAPGASNNVTFGGAVGANSALTGLAVRADKVSFGAATNRVGTLAANITGTTGAPADRGLSYTDAAGLTIGTVDGLSGVTTADGAINISADSLALQQTVTANANSGAGVSNVALTAIGAITGSGRVTGDALGLVAGTGAGTSGQALQTRARSLSASGGTGGVFINEFDAVAVTGGSAGAGFNLSAGGDLNVGGPVIATGGDIVLQATGGGDIDLSSASSDLTANAGDIRLTAEGVLDAHGGVRLNSRDIFLTAADFAGSILSDSVLLETANLSINDTAGGLTVGGVSATGKLTLRADGGLTINGGISNAGGLVLQTTGAGNDIVIGADLTAGGDTVEVLAGGKVDQTAGIITAGTLKPTRSARWTASPTAARAASR
jgi:filamentous hemagglutinin family protein